MCTHFSVFIYNIHLQNTDFEVIHKINKYYLIPFFLHNVRGAPLSDTSPTPSRARHFMPSTLY